MPDSEITTVSVPPGTIAVIPQGLDYTYDRINGSDVLSILVQDQRLGALSIALTPDGARHVAAHLEAMVDDLDELRAEWSRRSTKAGGR